MSAVTILAVIDDADIFPANERPSLPLIFIALANIVPEALISPEAVILLANTLVAIRSLALILPEAVTLPIVPETTKLFI